MILAKCNNDSSNQLEAQTIISKNNIEVLNDSMKTYRSKQGSLITEKGVLIASKEELKDINTNLYETIDDLSKEIKNAKPIVITKYKTKFVHDTIFVESELISINDSTYNIKFSKDTTYNENNSRHIAGLVTIDLLSDSSRFNKIKASSVQISKDEMHVDATLILGMKDDMLKVWIESKYPGFRVKDIEAVTLDPKIHPELRKLNNKKFSVGPYIGIGIGQNFTFQPSIGFGIQYTLIKF